LQEALQGLGMPQPSYVLVQEAGPEHSKIFTVEARLNAADGRRPAEFVGRAQGSTKKNAEQDAARQVLTYLASHSKAGGAPAARASRAVEK
jgi:ribonuclease-3